MPTTRVYTSESVSEGHPDKLADQVSDAILDAYLLEDNDSRVAVETLLTNGLAVIAGEVSSKIDVNVDAVVRDTIRKAGYVDLNTGFNSELCNVMVSIREQSKSIAAGMQTGGAGDQGIMYGMATNETLEMMPMPISIAHALTRRAAEVRYQYPSLGLRPDAKSQVSVIYEDGKPKSMQTIVLSQQHSPDLSQRNLYQIAMDFIITPVLLNYADFMGPDVQFLINPVSLFTKGGPECDTGLTGRKLMVDTYGGMCPHGGGAFSGKDPTKLDRSGAYMARFIAKSIVASGLAKKVQVALAYAFGVRDPIAVNIETFTTGTEDDERIAQRILSTFDLSTAGIVRQLGLKNVEYYPTAKNGHFGNPAFPWEQLESLQLL